jgi:hypothetical protein
MTSPHIRILRAIERPNAEVQGPVLVRTERNVEFGGLETISNGETEEIKSEDFAVSYND